MNLSTIPSIPVNYGSSQQQYVTHHVHSQQNTSSSSQQQQQQQQNNSSQSQSQQQQQSSFRGGWVPQTSVLGTGITDNNNNQLRPNYPSTNPTHSTPNSYTNEYFDNNDHQQSLGFGALSVTSSVINQPQTSSIAASTIQSALNNLNSHQLGLTAPSLIAQAPPLPVQSIQLIPNINKQKDIDKPNDNIKNDNNLNNPPSKPNNNSSNFYLAPGSANHGGSYRQTLNPAIYNAYRLSSTNNSNRSSVLPTIGIGSSSHRNSSKSPIVHVIAETVYRVPSNNNMGIRGGLNGSCGLNSIFGRVKQDRFDKTALYKTELCTNWMLTGSCTYGNKCHFAHGVEDLKPRMRVENYKTQPCCDPAREGCRRCMYGRRCNYCHPGESIRRPHPTPYYDKDYYNALRRDFGEDNEFPFGIYV